MEILLDLPDPIALAPAQSKSRNLLERLIAFKEETLPLNSGFENLSGHFTDHRANAFSINPTCLFLNLILICFIWRCPVDPSRFRLATDRAVQLSFSPKEFSSKKSDSI